MSVLRQMYHFIFYGIQKVFSCSGRHCLSKAAWGGTGFLISRQVMPGGLSVNSPALPRQQKISYFSIFPSGKLPKEVELLLRQGVGSSHETPLFSLG